MEPVIRRNHGNNRPLELPYLDSHVIIIDVRLLID